MASAATASKTNTPKPAAKLPANAGKLASTAARRLAHATAPANLKTLALLHEGNHTAASIAKAVGIGGDAIDGHLDTLRRAKLIGVEKADAGKVFHLTDEGRKLWEAAKLVG